LREVLAESNCERIVYIEHIIGQGRQLFERVRNIGAEGIASKQLGSPYRGRESRDWVKRKTGAFDPATFRDRYQEALRELIEAKIKGLPVKAGPAIQPPQVLDLTNGRAEAQSRTGEG
jgi:ATP-dependent DNA ligase